MRWGIISTGNIAHKFADTIAKMENQTVTAVASRELSTAKEFASQFGIPNSFGSKEEMLKSSLIDAVYVASPNMLHFEDVKLCLENKKAVLCEKPLTTSKAESQELYELAGKNKTFLMEGFWIRFLPLYEKLISDLKNGIIGTVTKIECTYGFISSGPRRLTKLTKELGGGALMDIGIYCLGFLKMVKPGKISYKGGTVEYCEFGTDEECVMDFGWEDGCTAHVDLSLKKVMARNAVIYGTKGKITIPDFQALEKYTVEVEGKAPYDEEPSDKRISFEFEIDEAEKCVKEGKTSSQIYTQKDSLDLIQLMDEVREGWR